jgi:hypothetical protein
MKSSISKNNVILILLLAAVLLLAVNIVVEKYYPLSASYTKIDLPGNIINGKFLASLGNYHLDSTWIISKKISAGGDDSLKFRYAVKVPIDLPVSLLLKEIQSQFDTSEVDILSTEFKPDNSTQLNISSGDRLKLIARFRYYPSISRNTDTVGFILTGIENLNNDELKNLLLIPEHFAAALVPSKHSQDLEKNLKDNQKEAAVLINDDISELEFKLKTGYSEKRNKNSVLSIIGKFHDAAFFIMDKKSDIYSSNNSRMILNEFAKRKLIIAGTDKFIDMGNSSPEDVIKSIKSTESNKRIFVVTADIFLEMPAYLASLRKSGYKYVNPSALIIP